MPRLEHVHDDQAHHQRQGRNHFKVEQGAHPNPAQFLHVFHASDTGDHREEDHRCQQHLDEFDEGIADGFERGTGFGVQHTNDGAENDGQQHLYVKLA